MDRNDRRSVIGTWPRHPIVPPPATLHERNPRGWETHHAAHTRPHPAELSPDELVEAVRERAHAIWLHRVATGALGSPLSDWLVAEAELRQN